MEHAGESKDPLLANDPVTELYGRTKHGGIIFRIMDAGGPTDDREDYVDDAVAEINRSKLLCFKANMTDPTDPSYRQYLEQLFLRKLDDVTILTPFYCDMGIRVRLGSRVFINDNVHLIAGHSRPADQFRQHVRRMEHLVHLFLNLVYWVRSW